MPTRKIKQIFSFILQNYTENYKIFCNGNKFQFSKFTGGSDNHPGSHGRPDFNSGSNKRPGGSDNFPGAGSFGR